jgi:hypothetical protein
MVAQQVKISECSLNVHFHVLDILTLISITIQKKPLATLTAYFLRPILIQIIVFFGFRTV